VPEKAQTSNQFCLLICEFNSPAGDFIPKEIRNGTNAWESHGNLLYLARNGIVWIARGFAGHASQWDL
jgi:hypothetical protein